MRAIHINKTTTSPADRSGVHHHSGAIIFPARNGFEVRGFNFATIEQALSFLGD